MRRDRWRTTVKPICAGRPMNQGALVIVCRYLFKINWQAEQRGRYNPPAVGLPLSPDLCRCVTRENTGISEEQWLVVPVGARICRRRTAPCRKRAGNALTSIVAQRGAALSLGTIPIGVYMAPASEGIQSPRVTAQVFARAADRRNSHVSCLPRTFANLTFVA